MRRILKNSILEIFKTMYEAHWNIKKFIEKKELESVQTLLADCRDTAVRIGTAIENSEGEGFVTVGFLEEYCEAVYEVSIGISEEMNGGRIKKNLDKKLIKAESSAKNDIKAKLEIVFLPYKSSMWDSLESVWKAADADPDCNAYVVPIPYYDRKPDGSFGEMHYEGADFPEYVPITHYEDYNPELMRPDVIYIHNPYDDNNYVTSVDPRFYSGKLKKYTDKLVYIPYFVLAEPDPNDEKTLDYISDFVLTPGVLNADEVIVQSEAMKQAYIKVLLKHIGDSLEIRKYLYKKILGMGSPKFDKVADAIGNNVVVPHSWKSLIFKPNGERKKVIFYNISVGALLRHNEKMLEKIRNVLDFFYNNRDDVVLLWRPHPLMEATIKSMRPQLWLEYKQIVDKYAAEGWGIYDDSSELDRAIAVSDAYYGDRSSVIELFHKAEKPVMKTSVDIIFSEDSQDNSKYNYLSFYSFDSIGNDIYFNVLNFNAVYRSDINGTYTEYLGSVPDEIRKINLYSSVIAKKGKLYFAPMNAEGIAIYDVKLNSFTKLLPNYTEYGKSGALSKFFGAITYKDYIYFIPCRYRAIVRLNTNNNKLEYFDDWYKKYFNNIPESDMLVKNAYFLKAEWLYMAFVNDNRLIKYNLETNEFEAFELSFYGEKAGFMDMCVNNGKIWLMQSYACAVVCFDEESRNCEVFADTIDSFPMNYPFINLLSFNNNLLLVSYKSNVSMEFDIEASEFKIAEIPEERNINTDSISHYFGRKISRDTVFLANAKEHLFVLKNFAANECKTIKYKDMYGYEKYKLLCFEKHKKSFITESSFFTLGAYIEYIKINNRDKQLEICHDYLGEKIYKYSSDT